MKHTFDIVNDSDMPVVNFDITEHLIWALRNKSRDHILVIPPGKTSGARERWKISKTIEIPRQHGGAIWFVGESSNAHLTGLHCEFEWSGETEGPMFLYSSTDWRFYGAPKFYGNAKKCKVGWQTTKVGSYNAGRMDWDGASWRDFQTAIQIGLTVGEVSNEVNVWGKQGFKNCDVGFKVVGHQALQQWFDNVSFDGDVGVGFDYYASGCLFAKNVYYNGLLLRLNSAVDAGGDAGKNTGKNNGLFRFENLKSDTQGSPRLLETTASIRADVIFDCGLQSGGDSKKEEFLKLKGQVVVTLRNFRCLGGGGTIVGQKSSDGFLPTVIMQGCRRFARVGDYRDDVRGDVRLIQRDCVNYEGVPIGEPQSSGISKEEVQAMIDAAKAEGLQAGLSAFEQLDAKIDQLRLDVEKFVTPEELTQVLQTLKVTWGR